LIPDAIARQWGIKGLVIGRVLRGGSAERAGLKGAREGQSGRIELGDVIVAIDGKAVSELDELLSVLDRHKVGDRVVIDTLREGKRYQLPMTLQAVE
ncbi:MAG: PDZ domain-containing protein, partial [Nitrospiraceae bacterium]